MTNGDKIRQMSDEELGKQLRSLSFCVGEYMEGIECPFLDKGISDCYLCVKYWLEQEAKDE